MWSTPHHAQRWLVRALGSDVTVFLYFGPHPQRQPPTYYITCCCASGHAILNPFSTAVPIWGQIRLIPNDLSPKRDWGPQRVNLQCRKPSRSTYAPMLPYVGWWRCGGTFKFLSCGHAIFGLKTPGTWYCKKSEQMIRARNVIVATVVAKGAKGSQVHLDAQSQNGFRFAAMYARSVSMYYEYVLIC